jgi:hypothetical protein
MEINVSEATYQHVKDAFAFAARSCIEVKGKGQMRMYFVDQRGELVRHQQCVHRHFFERLITRRGEFHEFVEDLQEVLKNLGVGILRIEKADLENLTFTMTVAEDLDCSGLPVCDEEICTYDEGFIAGLLSAYTNREFDVKEVDCWCSGDRVCRFNAKPAV